MDFWANFFSAYENPFSFYQLIAWIGVILYVFSFQTFDTKKTLAMWIPANLSFALHFWGLESFTAMFVALGSTFREFSAVFCKKKIFHFILIANLIFNAFIAFIFFENLFSMLPFMATLFVSIGIYFKESFYKYRLWSLGHNFSWFVFYIFIGSYAGTVQISLMFISNIIGLSRYYLKSQKAN